MTGKMSRKVRTSPDWVLSITKQAHELSVPVFWKEDLLSVMGEKEMVQELPESFEKILEEQKQWLK